MQNVNSVKNRKKNLYYSLFILLFLSVFLSRGVIIPGIGNVNFFDASIISVVAALVLSFSYPVKAFKGALLVVIVVGLVSVLSAGLYSETSSVIVGYVKFICHIFIAITAYALALKIGEASLYKFCIRFLIVALIISLIEIFTPAKNLIYETRLLIYQDWRVYLGSHRDIAYMGGFLRPTVFASEPSYLAAFYLIATLMSFILARNRQKILVITLWAIGLGVIRSPILLGFPAMLAAIAITDILRGRSSVLPGYLRISALALAFIGLAMASVVLGGRIERMQSGQDGSFDQRVLVPIQIAELSMKKYPLGGVGIGGNEVLEIDILKIYSSKYYFKRTKERITEKIGASLIAYFTYFGFAGSIIVFLSLFTLSKWISIGQSSQFWIYFLPFSLGLPFSLRIWLVFFLIGASLYLVKSRQVVTARHKNLDIVGRNAYFNQY